MDKYFKEPLIGLEDNLEIHEFISGKRWIHSKGSCSEKCVFHSPSRHHMKYWPKDVVEGNLISRLCPHGILHPDPDSMNYFTRIKSTKVSFLHTCDGCCNADMLPSLENILSELDILLENTE